MTEWMRIICEWSKFIHSFFFVLNNYNINAERSIDEDTIDMSLSLELQSIVLKYLRTQNTYLSIDLCLSNFKLLLLIIIGYVNNANISIVL